MPNPKYVSRYTGQDVESAITKALQLDNFEHQSDEIINGSTYHVLWKVKPTTTNQVNGVAVHPKTGKLIDVMSINGVISSYEYISEHDSISITDLDNLFK
jgi:hypothetical protein